MSQLSRRLGAGRAASAVRFRPVARRRSRVAIGVALVAVAVAGNVVIYSEAAATTTVAQLIRDVPAGETVDVDDIRWIDLGLVEPTVRVVEPATWPSLQGTYAKTRLVSGSLLVADSLQSRPLLTPGTAIVAITVDRGLLPAGLREQSLVEVVLALDAPPWSSTPGGSLGSSVWPESSTVDGQRSVLMTPAPSSAPASEGLLRGAYVDIVQARVVSLPIEVGPAGGRLSVSIEVADEVAHLVVTHDDPRIVLVAPNIPSPDDEVGS